jgi:hypothetical protein
MKLGTLVSIATLLFAASPLHAHHSLEAQYDPTQTITLRGTVTKINWSNPHVSLSLDVKQAERIVNWQVEMGSPNAQFLEGWRIDSFRAGDRVTVTIYRARDGSNLGFARKIAIGFH